MALFQLTVNSEVFARFYFRETSHMQNFVKINNREMAKSLCCLLALVTNFDVANMSFNAHIRVYFRIYSSFCC